MDPKLSRRILAELVALPSVHPDADGAGTKPGEAVMAGWVAEYLAKLGADVEKSEISPGRPNVVAIFEPQARKVERTVMFAPHLDTVGVTGMTVPAFNITVRGGRLYGRGACDTKGPAAALFCALHQWSQSKQRLRSGVRWMVVATAGEEQGSLGAEYLCQRRLSADFAIALEPTGLRVVFAAKGVLRARVTVLGRAAHASTPHRGLNAIYRLLPLMEEIRGPLARKLAGRVHPVLGGATVNLASVNGGKELNLVPASCAIGLDFRTHPNCTGDDVIALLDAAVSTRCPEAKVEILRNRASFVADRRNDWAERVRRTAKGWATADWFCDANIFNQFGIPAVAFGPGSIEQAHTKNEFIEERSLEEGARAFLGILSGEPSARRPRK